MIVQIYSIYDKKAGVYGQPFYASSDDVAMRTVASSVSPTSVLALYPGDYRLYNLGEFDDVRGVISSSVVLPVADIASIVPRVYRDCALDGTFDEESDDNAKKKSTSA